MNLKILLQVASDIHEVIVAAPKDAEEEEEDQEEKADLENEIPADEKVEKLSDKVVGSESMMHAVRVLPKFNVKFGPVGITGGLRFDTFKHKYIVKNTLFF